MAASLSSTRTPTLEIRTRHVIAIGRSLRTKTIAAPAAIFFAQIPRAEGLPLRAAKATVYLLP